MDGPERLSVPAPKKCFPFFSPILAGATLRERLAGCLGALLAICGTGLICGYFVGLDPNLPLLVAPVGASAVLVFAVPASPLAQPWPVIAGNTLSAFIGIAVAGLVHHPVVAAGLAVSLAIAAMSFTRSLHPPGGATALTAVLGGPAVAKYGLLFPLLPVALNSILLVALGIALHRLFRRRYPHDGKAALQAASAARHGFLPQDIDAALEAEDETFDIDRDDLDRLLQRVEHHARLRVLAGAR